jgi:hypothetical protein
MLRELLHRDTNRLFQLRIMPFTNSLWILLDYDVRIGAVILNPPFPFGRIVAITGRGGRQKKGQRVKQRASEFSVSNLG